MKITVVIAAYNEADCIGPLTARLIQVLDAMPDAAWELIYVLAGADGTREIAASFAAQRPQIRILYREKPNGLGNAFREGFAQVPPDTDFVVTMDADLNHQPEEIPRLVHAAAGGKADIVVGSRKVKGSVTDGAPLWKRSLSDSVNRAMRRLFGMPVADQTSGFRVYRAEAFRRISFDNQGFGFLPEILIRAHAMGLRIVEEPIHFIFREVGESKMNLAAAAWSYVFLFGKAQRARAAAKAGRKPQSPAN